MSCMVLGSFLLSQAIDDCSSLDMNVALRASQYLPQEGIHQRLTLHRLGIRGGFAHEQFASRIFLAQVQTGGNQGYIGIDGESIALRVEMVDLRYQPLSFLQISAGIVDDLWIESETIDWKLRDLEKHLAEEYQWGTRGQVGSSMSIQFPKDFGQFFVSYTAGEGAYRRERNNGKNTSALIQFYPLQSSRLGISLYGQDGSYGFDSARNHRVGGRITSEWGVGHLGVSALKSWGLPSDINDEPLLLSAWCSQKIAGDIHGVLRSGQLRRETALQAEWLAAISYSPQSEANIWIGWKGNRGENQTTSIAGSSAEQFQQQIFIQLNGRLEVL